MLRGISHLSVDFGSLSDENFELKEELEKAKLENRRLQIRLNSNVTNYSQLPLLMDSNNGDDEIYCLGGLGKNSNLYENLKTKLYNDGDDETEVEYLNDDEDTEEEERDDISETTASSVIPCDPLSSSSNRSPIQVEYLNDDEDTEEEERDDISETTASSVIPCDPLSSSSNRSPIRSKSSISNDSILLEENSMLKQKIEQLQDQMLQYENELSQLRQTSQLTISNLLSRYEEEVNLRKSLHDSLVQLRGNIRVFCRIQENSMLKQKIQQLQDQMLQYEDELSQLRQTSQLTISNL
uniref:Uncharacterized protein n=1 Tax=Panagrolaimus sp. ES5 TaxID=591445 RepID=A0AC34GBY7_9BILA